MGSEAAIWVGAALFAALVIALAVGLIRARRKKQATALSRDEKLQRARRAAGQISRDRRRTGRGSLRGKGGGGLDSHSHYLGLEADCGGSSGGGSD